MDVDAKDNNGETPLHLAVSNGNLNLAELLLSRGADVNAQNNDGKTASDLAKHLSPEENKTEIQKILDEENLSLRRIKAKRSCYLVTPLMCIATFTIASTLFATKKIEVNAINITYAAGIIALSTLIVGYTAYQLVFEHFSIPSSKLESTQQSKANIHGATQQVDA